MTTPIAEDPEDQLRRAAHHAIDKLCGLSAIEDTLIVLYDLLTEILDRQPQDIDPAPE